MIVVFQGQFSRLMRWAILGMADLFLSIRHARCDAPSRKEAALRPLELDLDVYQGPFDLLLSLVLKEEIDLLEVPLFEVISAYLEEMEDAGVVGYWDEMTEFLLLMSLLVEVKSRLLLPDGSCGARGRAHPRGGPRPVPGAAVRVQQVQGGVAAAPRAGRGQRGVPVARPVWREAAPSGPSGRHSSVAKTPWRCGSAWRISWRARRPPDTSHLAQIKVELQRQMRIVRGILARHRRFSFNRIFGGEQPLVQALSRLRAARPPGPRGDTGLRSASCSAISWSATADVQKTA